MIERSWMERLNSFSDNRKSKIQNRKLAGIVAVAVVFVLCGAAASAQQPKKVPRVGLLWDSPAMFPSAIEAFQRGLRDLGWVEGQNIVVERRWSEGRFDRLRDLAEELVRLQVDVIVAPSSIYTEAAKGATSTIPIIFVSHADPIGSGHVASLRAARRQHQRVLPNDD